MEIEEISDDDELYRRLAPDTVDRARKAVKRNAYLTRGTYDCEISVYLKRLTPSPEQALANAGRPHFGMGLLRVSAVKALGFDVLHRPVPGHPAHALIVGNNSRKLSDRLAEITTLVILPQ